MEESDWLNATDPTPMLEFLRSSRRASDRKLQLFAVGCIGRLWHLLTDERSRRAVAAVEAYAEGQLLDEELIQARNEAFAAVEIDYEEDGRMRLIEIAGHITLLRGLSKIADVVLRGFREFPSCAAPDLIRDIFGPLPFRAVLLDPAWITWNDRTVVNLAQAIYGDRAFDRLPILADALEEAGCDNKDILDHCRQAGEVHVRGCWVTDLLLGKA